MAILLTLICPGLGHLYNGRPFQGLFFFVITIVGYMAMIFPGVIIHLFLLLDVQRDKERRDVQRDRRQAEMIADAMSRRQ